MNQIIAAIAVKVVSLALTFVGVVVFLALVAWLDRPREPEAAQAHQASQPFPAGREGNP